MFVKRYTAARLGVWWDTGAYSGGACMSVLR